MSTIARIHISSDPKQTARPSEQVVFRMRAEFRRCAVYVLVGIALIPTIRWALNDFFPPAKVGAWGLLGPCSVLALCPIAVLRWRLRVDASGISRRRFVRWDLWPWEVFEQGNVLDAEDESTSYVFPEKPFWARKLDLGLLEDGVRDRVDAVVARLRVRPSLDLPAELALRYGMRKEALITAGCLLLRDRGVETRYSWKETQILRIRRRNHRRRDFNSLELVLPDRVVTFFISRDHGQLIRSWSGTRGHATPTAEILSGVLERMIPRDRVQVTSLSESPLTIDEWQDRHSILAKNGRDLTIMRRIIWVFSVLMLLHSFSFYPRGIFAVIGMMVMYAITLVSVVMVMRYIERDHRKAFAKLEEQIPGR